MRIIATADLQLGAGAGYLPVAYGPGSRLDDHQRAWIRVVELAIEHDAAAIIVAGDVFEEKRPGPTAYRSFQAGISLARSHGIPVVIVAGNHDVRSADETTAIEVFYDFEHRVFVHRTPATGYLGDGVHYAVLPWTTMGGLAALRGGGDRDLLHAEAGELLVEVAAGLREQIRQTGARHAILIAHWAVSGAAMPTGISSDELREVVIPTHLLDEQGWDAIVLGHIHRGQFVTEDVLRPAFYCGSPLPCDFGEAGYAHGAWLLDLGGEHAFASCLPIESRPFVTLDVLDPASWPADLDGAVVRVVGKVSEATREGIDLEAARRDLLEMAGAAAVRVDVEVMRETRARDEHVTADLGASVALDHWITAAQPACDHAILRARHGAYLEQEHAA